MMSRMCGIVGYVGPGSSRDVLLGGLQRLEYRGYDSSGIAVIADANASDAGQGAAESGTLQSAKKAGKLEELLGELKRHPIADGHTGIGHTRWATHGGPTDENAHPQLSDGGKLAVIHNGIIENFAELREEVLAAGVELTSETDTEIAAHLIGLEHQRTGSLEAAFKSVVDRLEGAFTLLAIHQDEPGLVVGARLNSPLVVGLGEDEMFLGSDVAAFVEHTRHAMAIGQGQIVAVRADGVRVTDFAGNEIPADELDAMKFDVSWDAAASEKGGWPSFMAKEIDENPIAVENTIRGRIRDGLVNMPELNEAIDPQKISRIIIVACGTASYAGMVGAYGIEAWARVPVTVELAHEFRYRAPILDENTLVVSISQSGETMDTLMAVRYAKELGAHTLSICNTQGATIPRESDAVVYTHAGPEVAVASTKAFLGQITALYLLGMHLGAKRGTLGDEAHRALAAELVRVPDAVRTVLEVRERIEQMAGWMSDTRAVLFLGRHVGYPIALEGALKLKELAYIHAEGFAAGELKHGPIALIEPGQPVFVVVPSPRHDDTLHPKVISNIQEIRARGARVIAICEQGDAAVLPFADEVIGLPPTNAYFEPLLAVVPLQMFAMGLSEAKGLDVDRPRNLAKSVTVE